MKIPKGKRERASKIFEEIMVKNFPYLMKKILIRPWKLNKPQVKVTQRDPHLATLWHSQIIE